MSSKEKSKHHHDRSDKEHKEKDRKDKDSKKEKKSKKGDDESKAQEPMPQWAQLPVNKNDDPFRDDFEVEIKFKE
ncbi:hypothetical protein TVAG_150990 [Trichomonas vaginalis G3]|uniref:Uncharacterized protein n=1 Tax=Trichomonas vaginalis (strain ATCC PRA-98 / G3) TaxID=412133 RepID=A2FM11_TRIV3|nr:hypothetical protein TVAGG3_0165870 [Trichomonas vaginalis G3]EAX94052.1 hypothetical protein TVAG_150990 [Trichomonas vaginalis G3]KAI5548218.1 hypothetical protein TVAGG3_0165870 [Trichomonas vaginalis G3]|eukprot:XP_001306982.1 hypothetical protein [Trichomonas vaginalis G3]